jgi:hypothetical protein
LNAGDEEVPMEEIAPGAQLKPASLVGHAQALHDRDFAHKDYYSTLTLRA